MDEQKFWSMVQTAHEQSAGDMDEKCERIQEAVSKLSGPDAATFSAIFDAKLAAAYAWPLWGAAYVINGGCGDDSFSDFRAALISRGREAFESALADPDSLALVEFDEEAWFYEGYQYAVMEGAEAALGSTPPASPHPAEPSGQRWSEESVYGLFPRLAAKFA